MGDENPDLFAPRGAYARRTDPATSQQAAASVNVTKLEGLVIKALMDAGRPMISPEIAELTGKGDWSISPRMKPLEAKGLVERDGEAKRADGTGKMLTRWRATALARERFTSSGTGQ